MCKDPSKLLETSENERGEKGGVGRTTKRGQGPKSPTIEVKDRDGGQRFTGSSKLVGGPRKGLSSKKTGKAVVQREPAWDNGSTHERNAQRCNRKEAQKPQLRDYLDGIDFHEVETGQESKFRSKGRPKRPSRSEIQRVS